MRRSASRACLLSRGDAVGRRGFMAHPLGAGFEDGERVVARSATCYLLNVFTERVRSRSARREATRQKVLASAERLFRERGFAATTVRQIAADAQVSTGSVMAVGDKDALLVAIFDGWIAGVHRDRSADHDAAGPSLTPAAAVQEVADLLQPFIEYFGLDRELSREYAAIVVRGAHESAIFRDIALALMAEFDAVLARTGLTRADANQGGRVLYFAYLGILMSAGNGTIDDPTAVDRIREVVQFIVTHKGE